MMRNGRGTFLNWVGGGPSHPERTREGPNKGPVDGRSMPGLGGRGDCHDVAIKPWAEKAVDTVPAWSCRNS
eukprot:3882904-Pyramimonas_sp.AAC.1